MKFNPGQEYYHSTATGDWHDDLATAQSRTEAMMTVASMPQFVVSVTAGKDGSVQHAAEHEWVKSHLKADWRQIY